MLDGIIPNNHPLFLDQLSYSPMQSLWWEMREAAFHPVSLWHLPVPGSDCWRLSLGFDGCRAGAGASAEQNIHGYSSSAGHCTPGTGDFAFCALQVSMFLTSPAFCEAPSTLHCQRVSKCTLR